MSVRAKVSVVLTIPAHSVWSDETTMEQIFKQAKEDVDRALNRAIFGPGGTPGPLAGARIESMKVEAVMVPEKSS